MALGFSLLIGTLILVGSLLPFAVDGLPQRAAFAAILAVVGGLLATGFSLANAVRPTPDSRRQPAVG